MRWHVWTPFKQKSFESFTVAVLKLVERLKWPNLASNKVDWQQWIKARHRLNWPELAEMATVPPFPPGNPSLGFKRRKTKKETKKEIKPQNASKWRFGWNQPVEVGRVEWRESRHPACDSTLIRYDWADRRSRVLILVHPTASTIRLDYLGPISPTIPSLCLLSTDSMTATVMQLCKFIVEPTGTSYRDR